MARTVWFVMGTAAGAYGVSRAKRAAEAFTYDGLSDRLAGAAAGLRVWTAEVRQHAGAREQAIRDRLSALETGSGRAPALPQACDVNPLAATPQRTPALELAPGLTLVKRTDN